MNENNPNLLYSPWTDEQVKKLNEWQTAGFVHPFTCGNDKCRADLVATKDGWVCPTGCGYKQNWAHKFMANSYKMLDLGKH